MTEALLPIMGVSYRYRDDIDKYRDFGLTMVVVAVPWGLLAPHEKQAQLNHRQSLRRLAERGGLCASEAVKIIEGRDLFRHRLSEPEAHQLLRKYVEEFEAKAAATAIAVTCTK